MPERAKPSFDDRGVVLIDLAAERRDRKAHHDSAFQRALDKAAAQNFVALVEDAGLSGRDAGTAAGGGEADFGASPASIVSVAGSAGWR